MSTAVKSAKSNVQDAARGEEIGWAGRAGLVAMGVSYGLVAVLAMQLVLGRGGKATDREGALQAIAQEGVGRVAIILLAFGFAGYAIWRLALAIFDRGDKGSGIKGLGKRAGYLGRAAIYGALCVVAVSILMGSHGSRSEKEDTAWVLGWPGGRWLVGAVAAGFLVAGGWNVVRGVLGKWKDQLDTGSMAETTERIVTAVAVVGLLSRGVVFGLIGIFLAKAAWEYDAKEAIGLDGALRKLAAQSHGEALLALVAAGLLAYGVYCLFEARYRKV